MREGWRWVSIHPHLYVCIQADVYGQRMANKNKTKQTNFSPEFELLMKSICPKWACMIPWLCVMLLHERATVFVNVCVRAAHLHTLCAISLWMFCVCVHARTRGLCALEPCASCSYKARIHRFAAGSWRWWRWWYVARRCMCMCVCLPIHFSTLSFILSLLN